MLNEFMSEAAKAVIWMLVGLFPVLFGIFVNMFIDIRSLKKAMNAAFKKLRELEGEKCPSGRKE